MEEAVKQKVKELRSQFGDNAKYVALEVIEESKLYEYGNPVLLGVRLNFWRKVNQELENNIMEEVKIKFDTAKLAKEKGFILPCNSYFFEDGEFRENKLTGTNGYYGDEYSFELEEFDVNWNDKFVTDKNGDRCFGCNKSNKYFETYSAPTQSILQKWLREVHKIHITIAVNKYAKKIWQIELIILNNEGRLDRFEPWVFNSYEEALEAGLLEGLKFIS